MNKLAFLMLLILSLSTSAEAQQGVDEYKTEGYELVWSDEFDQDGKVNAENWTFEYGFVRNEELQWYQEENAWVEDGFLIIEAREERKINPTYHISYSHWGEKRRYITHTSSSLNTRGNHKWLFGRFEMRAKIDISDGLWPAFWTLGEDKEWPSNGEIDIMEYYKGKILANIACGTTSRWNPEWHSTTRSIEELGGKSWADDFHVWRMDWTPEYIALYVDDDLMIKKPIANLYNKDSSGFNPFMQPHYILINLALGGINGGELNDTKFPSRYLIDYVRVYQRRD